MPFMGCNDAIFSSYSYKIGYFAVVGMDCFGDGFSHNISSRFVDITSKTRKEEL